MNPVPDAYLGVWQRRLLTTTAGGWIPVPAPVLSVPQETCP